MTKSSGSAPPDAFFTPFDPSDIRENKREESYRGFGTLYTYDLIHKKFDGTWTGEMRREVYDTGDAVVVLPYNPVTDHVVLIEQFRVTAHHTKRHPWLIECIAGRIEGTEAPEETARREAMEEAGLTLTTLYPINSMFMSPGVYSEYTTMYCGLIDAVSEETVHGLEHEHEDIRVLNIAFDEALLALDSGRIATAPPQVCLNWLARFRERIRAGVMPDALSPRPVSRS